MALVRRTLRLVSPLLLLVLPGVAAADWLVLRDGSRIETKGPWEVRGKVVVFTIPSGTLGSVRLDHADLEQSRLATEAAARPKPTPTPTPVAKKEPVLRLTDADVGHVDAVTLPSAGATAASSATGSSASATAERESQRAETAETTEPVSRLTVSNWQRDVEGSSQGASIVGQITNTSPDFVQDIEMTASLLDDQGELLADAEALLGARSLMPGQVTNFRATFPGVFNYVSVKFRLEGVPFRVQAPPGSPPSD